MWQKLKLEGPILFPFEECGLKKVADVYIDFLPKHLRPKKFDEIFREEVDPEYKTSICPQAQHGFVICSFQEEKSEEFQEGLKRLLIQNRQDPKEFKQTIQKLQCEVKIKCIGQGNIKIHFIRRDTDEVVDHLTTSCYAVREERTWSLYIQHEFEGDRGLVSAAIGVNHILGECVAKEKRLIAMRCGLPNEISGELDKLDITPCTTNVADEFDNLDDEILELDGGDESVSGVRDSQSFGFSPDVSGSVSFHTGGHSVGYRGGSGHHSG